MWRSSPLYHHDLLLIYQETASLREIDLVTVLQWKYKISRPQNSKIILAAGMYTVTGTVGGFWRHIFPHNSLPKHVHARNLTLNPRRLYTPFDQIEQMK